MQELRRPRRLIATLFGVFSVAVFLTGIGLAVYACVQWLQTAHWQPLTVNDLLTRWAREWVVHPRAWLGLHRIIIRVRSVPVFVVVTLLGGVMIVLSPPLRPSPTWQNAW